MIKVPEELLKSALNESTMLMKLISNETEYLIDCNDLIWEAADFSKIECWTEVIYNSINGKIISCREIKSHKRHNYSEILRVYGPGRIF